MDKSAKDVNVELQNLLREIKNDLNKWRNITCS